MRLEQVHSQGLQQLRRVSLVAIDEATQQQPPILAAWSALYNPSKIVNE